MNISKQLQNSEFSYKMDSVREQKCSQMPIRRFKHKMSDIDNLVKYHVG